jgi:cytidine deaminase
VNTNNKIIPLSKRLSCYCFSGSTNVKKYIFVTKYLEYPDMNNLSEFEKTLVEKAKTVARRSYSPYSEFPVGCAIVDEEGKVFVGCNVENASYGLSICAERNAVFSAISLAGKDTRIRLAIIYTPTQKPTTPCGACRQVFQEFSDDLRIICACDSDEVFIGTLSDLFTNPPHIER